MPQAVALFRSLPSLGYGARCSESTGQKTAR